jgi:hypothetical protein
MSIFTAVSERPWQSKRHKPRRPEAGGPLSNVIGRAERAFTEVIRCYDPNMPSATAAPSNVAQAVVLLRVC